MVFSYAFINCFKRAYNFFFCIVCKRFHRLIPVIQNIFNDLYFVISLVSNSSMFFVVGTCLNFSLRLGVGLCFGVGLGVGVGTEIKYCNYFLDMF